MSGKEQLSFALGFVEDGGAICEEFLGFVHLERISQRLF